MVTRILKAHACGEIDVTEELTPLSLNSSQWNHVNTTIKFIDDVVFPFKDLILENDFDSATTPRECYDIAVEKAIKLGLVFAAKVIFTGGASSVGAVFSAIELYMIYLDYDACLERVNSHP